MAKWMEAVAYLIQTEPCPDLQAKVEWLIDCIEQNQHKDGYFNIYHTVCEPENRFKNRGNHELYCAGHLIEAEGYRKLPSSNLYSPMRDDFEKTTIKLVPYYGFANRGESDMLVWVNYR